MGLPNQCHCASHHQAKDFQNYGVINDAWRGMRHVVQIRAQEEFGHGDWSEWSQEAMGTPWIGTMVGVEGTFELLTIPVTVAM